MRLGLGLAGLTLVLDQITKWFVLFQVMDPPRTIEVLPFLNLVIVWNQGVSFGMFGGGAVPPWAFAVLSAVICVALLVWLRRAETNWTRAAIGLVIGGAVGNVVDRILFGAVFDFLDLHVAGWHWPAFNLADSAISVGVVLLLVESLLPERKAST
ncbi:MAG: signal peptidase II [Alphaproteobacteria bacterium]